MPVICLSAFGAWRLRRRISLHIHLSDVAFPARGFLQVQFLLETCSMLSYWPHLQPLLLHLLRVGAESNASSDGLTHQRL